MSSPAIFSGRRSKLLTADGLLMQSGATIDNDGLVNFIPTGNAESGTIPATMYANGAAVPTTGTGGSPTATFTITTTDPLQGSKSFVFTPGALGNGASIPFTVTRDCFGRALQIACSYEIATAASFADGDLTFYVKCPSGTIQQCVNFQFLKASGPMQFKALFQAEASGTQYYLLIHQATANTAYGSVKLDSITSGPQQSTVVATGPVGEIIATGSLTPPSGFLYCNGNAVSRSTYADLFAKIGTTFGSGDGSTTFNVPDLRGEFLRGADNGRGIDAGRVLGSSQASQMQSHNHYPGSSGTTAGYNTAKPPSPYLVSRSGADGGPYFDIVTSSAGGTSNNSENRPRNVAVAYHIRFQASTIASSEASDGRPVVATIGFSGSTLTVPAASTVTLPYNNVLSDNLSAFNTSTYKYQVKVPGYYSASASCRIAGMSATIDQYMRIVAGGTSYAVDFIFSSWSWLRGTITTKYLNAGDEIYVTFQNNQPSNSVDIQPSVGYFTVERLPNGSSIAFDGVVPFAGVGQGTATNPPVTFFGDSDTGIFSPAANTVGVATGGGEKFRVNSNGVLNSVVQGGSTLYPAFMCRAWVSFYGQGTNGTNQTIYAAGNVTSCYKNGSGDYTVNFSTAMPHTGYAVALGIATSAAGYYFKHGNVWTRNTGWVQVLTGAGNSETAFQDMGNISVSIFC